MKIVNKKSKILFIASQVEGNGGIPRFNRNLIKALQNGDNDLKIVSLNDENENNGFIGHRKNKINFIYSIIKLILLSKPNKIIIGLLNFAPLAILGKAGSSNVFVVLHGIEAWYRRKKLKPFFNYVEKFLAVSGYTKDIFLRENNIDKAKIDVIGNTVPNHWLKLHDDVTYNNFFLSVTRLDAAEGYKGVDKTIKALVALRLLMQEKNWKYIIVASGNDLERHKQMAITEGVESYVVFKEGISDDELKKLYASCNFFVLPSTGEGFGIVYLEAMVYKKACIGALGCGAEDVIEHQRTGYLISPSVENIQEALNQLMNDQEIAQKMGYQGYLKLISEFTFNQYQKRINSILKCVE